MYSTSSFMPFQVVFILWILASHDSPSEGLLGYPEKPHSQKLPGI